MATHQQMNKNELKESQALVKQRATQLPTPAPAALQRAISQPDVAKPADIMALQHSYGNRAVASLLTQGQTNHRPPVIQAKLTVGPIGDQYEREADQVASQVLSMPEPAQGQQQAGVQRQEDEDLLQEQPLQRQEDEEEEEVLQMQPLQRQEDEEELQMKSYIQRRDDGSFDPGHDFERHLQGKGGGAPLPSETRAELEPKFGSDFSQVRVHADRQAAQLNQQIQARAFTQGNNIYFGAGQYNPTSSNGKQLLAHELTHTIQQTGRIKSKPNDADNE